jgi:opacity protein-like surface antigen
MSNINNSLAINALTFVFTFVLINNLAFSQKNYIVKNNKISSGLNLIKGTPSDNALHIIEKKKGATVMHFPNDITEYGFTDGSVFRSFKIKTNIDSSLYFFERIFKGAINIYYLKNKDVAHSFYITPNDIIPLKAIPKDKSDYKRFLSKYLKNCDDSWTSIENVTLSKNKLRKLFTNNELCKKGYLPRLRYGFKISSSLNKLSSQKRHQQLSIPAYDYFFARSISAYVNVPLSTTNFSFLIGLGFNQYKYSEAFTSYNLQLNILNLHNLDVDQTRLNLPIAFRYTFLNLKMSPFIEAGAVYSTQIKGSSTLVSDNSISLTESSTISNSQIGLSVGAGMIFKYNSNFSFFIQAEHKKFHPTQKQSGLLLIEDFSFSVGTLF